MNIDDKKYTWGYIIVLAVIIILCLIGGLFGEAKAEECQHQFNNQHKCNLCGYTCNHPDDYLIGASDWDEAYDKTSMIREIACHCGYYGLQIHAHEYNVYTTFVYGDKNGTNYEYRDKTKCSCGKEGPIVKRSIPESDWSSWTYFATIYESNVRYDEYYSTVSAGGSTVTRWKKVHVHEWTESDIEESDRQYLHSDNMCYLEKHYEECTCGAKHQCDVVEYKHEMQCVDHADSTTTKHGFNEYCCANCNYSYRVELSLKKVEEKKVEEFYEKYYDEETNISYFESTTTSKYYYRSLNEAGDEYAYAASFEELFNANFAGFEEYDPLYFEKYFPYALTIKTGIYTPPEI